MPALTSVGANSAADLLWLEQPGDPASGPVRCFENESTETPSFVVLRRTDDATVREVRRSDGKIVLTVFQTSKWFRTSWTVNTSDLVDAYAVSERRRDALWRRTIGRLTKVDFGAADDAAIVLAPIVIPAWFAPANRLQIKDRSGRAVGFVTIPPAAIRPRESYCLYLDDEPLPRKKILYALLAMALVQDLK